MATIDAHPQERGHVFLLRTRTLYVQPDSREREAASKQGMHRPTISQIWGNPETRLAPDLLLACSNGPELGALCGFDPALLFLGVLSLKSRFATGQVLGPIEMQSLVQGVDVSKRERPGVLERRAS
ncbi:hypothetical protein JDV02_005931 [Purpureocillium takamizusanense]|uniref:Uncharacterized protein n=1 Tax=Purpureocillium takamizusanense TaxID=2060973 RepID=A0A9Q8VCG2_9HYPO|nr:uncharacterized protein JDV02_005931 [Purpureocillium takamizusanense]UNI19772.1 hypothetical protein JDV02_005931 [Purpureocillium takamizusanense]